MISNRRRLASGISVIAIADASRDRKSTRLNSSHLGISYAVFCLKKKKHTMHGKLQSLNYVGESLIHNFARSFARRSTYPPLAGITFQACTRGDESERDSVLASTCCFCHRMFSYTCHLCLHLSV